MSWVLLRTMQRSRLWPASSALVSLEKSEKLLLTGTSPMGPEPEQPRPTQHILPTRTGTRHFWPFWAQMVKSWTAGPSRPLLAWPSIASTFYPTKTALTKSVSICTSWTRQTLFPIATPMLGDSTRARMTRSWFEDFWMLISPLRNIKRRMICLIRASFPLLRLHLIRYQSILRLSSIAIVSLLYRRDMFRFRRKRARLIS